MEPKINHRGLRGIAEARRVEVGDLILPELPLNQPGLTRPGFGLFNVWKPTGITSRQVVDLVGNALGTSRVGHAGTLDPLATGVLVLCAGQASRLVPFVQEQRKEYIAEFRLGCTSDTDDVTGKVAETLGAVAPPREQIADLIPKFMGRIEQVPPDFSAVKVRGRRAHHLARKGRDVKIPARIVEVFRLELLAYEYPRLEVLVECGSGTYVRSIGRDLGNLLGCGGVLSKLIRTRVGPFNRENAVALEDLSAETLARNSLPTRFATEHLPQHTCTPFEMCEFVQGRPFPWQPEHAQLPDRADVALLDADGELAALAQTRHETQRIHPYLVFVDRETILQQFPAIVAQRLAERMSSTLKT